MQLLGQFRYTLHTDKLSAATQIAERVHALAQEQNDAALMLAAYEVFAAIFYFLGEFDFARKYARHGVQIWRSGSVQSPVAEEIQAPVVNCLSYEAMSDWHFGEIASCHALMDEGISIANELKDTNALVLALVFATGLALNLELLSTQSGEKHTAEPVQSGAAITMLKSFSNCYRLVDCLKSFRGTIR
jgi:hypothetical protein